MSNHGFLQVLQTAGLYDPGTAEHVDLSDLPTAPAGDPDAQRYAQKALEYETDEVAQSNEGTRNETLNRAAFKLGSLVTSGHLDGQTVIDSLQAAARASGLPASEINRVVWRGVRDGGKQPREVRLNERDDTPAAYTLTAVPDNATDDNSDAASMVDELVASVGDIDSMYPVLDWPTVWDAVPDEVEWVAYPVFERGRLYSLYSPAKAGKSLLALDIVASLAAGRDVLGQPATGPMRVLYVDLENSPTDLVERLQDLGYGPHDLDGLRYMSFPSLPSLDSPRGGRHLLAAAAHHQADVVVIDTVSRLIHGGENDSDTFHALYRYAMAPLKALEKTVIRLDHAGKDEEKGMRGSSAKVSDVDAAWKLSRTGDERLRLDRMASRNSHSPEYVTLEQEAAPLRHVLVEGTVSDEVSQLARTMDRLGIPESWGRDRCRQKLVEVGHAVRNSTLSEAIRVRKTTVEEAS